MSINFYVLPGTASIPPPEVANQIEIWLRDHTPLSDPVKFIRIRAGVRSVEEVEEFLPENGVGYTLEVGDLRTSISVNRSRFDPEAYTLDDLLEDVEATEPAEEERERMENSVREYGYISIQSTACRSEDEKYVLQALLVALAEVSDGWIGSLQEVFDLNKGLFRAADLDTARWSRRSIPRLKKLDARTNVLKCKSFELFRQLPDSPEPGGPFSIKQFSPVGHETVLEAKGGLFLDNAGQGWVFGIGFEGRDSAVVVGTDRLFWIGDEFRTREYPLNRTVETPEEAMVATTKAISYSEIGVLLATMTETLRISPDGEEVWRRPHDSPPTEIGRDGVYFSIANIGDRKNQHWMYDAFTGQRLVLRKEEGGEGSTEPVRVKLMADSEEPPLWHDTDGRTGSIHPAHLPVSDVLQKELIAWSNRYDSGPDGGNASESGFEESEEARGFDREGRRLWKRLIEELGDRFRVRYYSPLENRLLEEPAT